jgi:hypothetical protein
MTRDGATYLAATLALAVLITGGWRLRVRSRSGPSCTDHIRRATDKITLRQITGLVVVRGEVPMKDGAFDPYVFVREGVLRGENLFLLRSERRGGEGPSEEEIACGDYARFPWERYRGEKRPLKGPPFPLLWEKRPDKYGVLLAATSDGRVHEWDQETLERRLAEAGIGR